MVMVWFPYKSGLWEAAPRQNSITCSFALTLMVRGGHYGHGDDDDDEEDGGDR